MIEWLRTLSSALRSSVYVGGALLMCLIAVGVGATAAVVVSWQFERAATGTADTGNARTTTPEGGELKTTGPARASEGRAIEPSTDSRNPDDKAYDTSYVHHATEKNSRGDYTFISHPSIDGHANAIVLTSPTSDQKNVGTTSYKHNIGVWYAPASHKWAIFNEHRAPVPAGATFEVVVLPASAKFVHHADLSNTAGDYTYSGVQWY